MNHSHFLVAGTAILLVLANACSSTIMNQDAGPDVRIDAPRDAASADGGSTDVARPDATTSDVFDAAVPDTAIADVGADLVVDVPPPPVCGNSMVEGTEQCDDGNSADGDGCDNDCTWSCTADTECADTNACNGVETCDMAMHRCAPGTAVPSGTSCGAGSICIGGACAMVRCGDGVTTAPESCDDMNSTAGDGCENDCSFSCVADAGCDDMNPCSGTERCDTTAHRCLAGTPAADGTSCGGTRVCRAGMCASAACGNRMTEPGEDCDDGNTTLGDGCENDCRFTCLTDARCADANTCNGAETCVIATHTCRAGTTVTDGTVCDADMNATTRDLCRTGMCRASTCGDGFVDVGRGETCEPPTAGCSATTCTMMALPRCGNGMIETGEECDDNNVTRWDGCSPTCRLEQTVRANYLALRESAYGCDITGDGAIDNQLGRALSTTARNQLNTSIQDGVTMGTTVVLAHFLDLDDRLGRNDPAVRVAFFGGTDTVAPFANTRGEDFTIAATELNAMGDPTSILSPAAIAATALSAGPGTVTLRLALGGPPTPLTLYRARMTGTVVADTMMNRIDSVSTMAAPGRICGAITAGDLDRIPAPTAIPVGCRAAAPLVSSLLDVIVRGCTLIIPIVNATQPDIDIGADGIFVGTGRALQDTNGDRMVDTCRDSTTGTVITGNDCAQDPRFDDAYSTALSYAAIRVRISGVR